MTKLQVKFYAYCRATTKEFCGHCSNIFETDFCDVLSFFFHHKMNTFNFYFVRVKKVKPVWLVNHMVPSSLVTPLRNVLCELLAPFVTMLPKMLCSSAMEALGCHL